MDECYIFLIQCILFTLYTMMMYCTVIRNRNNTIYISLKTSDFKEKEEISDLLKPSLSGLLLLFLQFFGRLSPQSHKCSPSKTTKWAWVMGDMVPMLFLLKIGHPNMESERHMLVSYPAPLSKHESSNICKLQREVFF